MSIAGAATSPSPPVDREEAGEDAHQHRDDDEQEEREDGAVQPVEALAELVTIAFPNMVPSTPPTRRGANIAVRRDEDEDESRDHSGQGEGQRHFAEGLPPHPGPKSRLEEAAVERLEREAKMGSATNGM